MSGFADGEGTAGKKIVRAGSTAGGFGGKKKFTVVDDFRGDTVDGIGQMGLVQLAFPHDDDGPPMGLQLPPDLLIPRLIARHLRCPELRIRLWHRILAAPLMPMPEAPMDKHHGPIPRQHHIRTPRQPPIIHPIPKPPPPQFMPENNLRLCVCGMNRSHVGMALGGGVIVGHICKDTDFLRLVQFGINVLVVDKEGFCYIWHKLLKMNMNEDLDFIQYSIIRDYRYADWFQNTQYNGKTLTDKERKEFISIIDEEIAYYSDGLSEMYSISKELENENIQNELHELQKTISSVLSFVTITMADCMVACKYYLLADTDYDKRFMRGKLKVLLNEGFKKLYGYNDTHFKKSEWFKLLATMTHFPEPIYLQYQELTILLERHSKMSFWWKEERVQEVHYLDMIKLYESRQEDLNESKVMMENLRLFNALLAVSHFLGNENGCVLNYLISKYRRGEMKEK